VKRSIAQWPLYALSLCLAVSGCRIEREVKLSPVLESDLAGHMIEDPLSDVPGQGNTHAGASYDSWAPDQLRIMTFNVRFLLGSADEAQRLIDKGLYGLDDKRDEAQIEKQHNELADAIAHHQPDVVCLQEVINEEALNRLVKALDYKEAYYEPHFVNSGSTYLEQDVVFLTKLSPDKTSDERVYRPQDPSKAAVLELEFQGQKLAFLGIHLLARPDDRSRKVRREQEAAELAEVLLALKAQGRSPIILGDFNDWDRETPDTDLGASPISNVFEIIKDFDNEIEGPELFNAAEYIENLDQRYTHIYRGSRTMLDHILLPLSLRTKVSSAFIEHRSQNISDHRPVLVDLQF